MTTPDIAEETLYCTVHTNREATLRCNKCGRPMCVQCAVQTPVGYRCKECVRGIQAKYFNANPYDDLIAFGVAAAATGIISYVVSSMNLPLFLLFIVGFPVGGVIGELIVRAVRKRRGRNMGYWATAGVVIGGLAAPVLGIIFVAYPAMQREAAAGRTVREVTLDFNVIFQLLFSDIGLLIMIGLIAVAVYSRLRMRG